MAPNARETARTIARRIGSEYRGRRGGWPEAAVRSIHVGADVLQGLPFVKHAHHVPRDVHADPSPEAHGVKDDFSIGFDLLDVALGVTRVLCPAPAVTGDLPENIPVGDGKSVGLADGGRRLSDLGGQSTLWRQRVGPGMLAPAPPKGYRPEASHAQYRRACGKKETTTPTCWKLAIPLLCTNLVIQEFKFPRLAEEKRRQYLFLRQRPERLTPDRRPSKAFRYPAGTGCLSRSHRH